MKTLEAVDLSPAQGKDLCKEGNSMMELEQILKNFLDADGKLVSFPAKRKMKLYALFYLAQKIEPNREYTEREINERLMEWHTFGDPATLCRELYDYRFLDRSRDGKVYRLGEKQPTFEEMGVMK